MLVTLSGSGFADGATVTFGGVSATSVVVASSHYITCQTPTHAAGAVNVVVTNPDAQASNAVVYTYLSATVWWEPDWEKVVIPKIPIDPSTIEPPPPKKIPPPAAPCSMLLSGAVHAGTSGTVYAPVVLSAAGGTAPHYYSLLVGDLPPGLSLKGASITGTPSQEGVYSFVIQLLDSDNCADYGGYTIIIWPAAEDFTPTLYPWEDLDPIYPDPITLDRPITVVPGWPPLPIGTIFPWVVSTAPTSDKGWWNSVDEAFSGAAHVISNAVPRDPRGFVEVVAFATGSSSNLGGFPGVAGTWKNHLIYAKGGYTVGTDLPTIRLFDGTFDREVVSIPKTSAGVVPKAIMSILVSNDTIYLSTFDSGTTSANWSGRVFTLDPDRGTLTPLGDPFPAGHVPYALAWHMGRLWAGTNRGDPTAAGKVYFFRPDIDTTWTEDYDLASSSVAGVASLLPYKGLLYVGTTAAALTFAKVLVRSGVGAYTTSDTGTGGAATAGNAFLALAEFSGKLYSSYFNNDTTKISKIRKFDNSSWSASYTGASGTLVPYLGFPIDGAVLLAIGGGVGFSAALVSTPDGVTWTDRTAFLFQDVTTSTGLPAFGKIVV